jgi:hypothetical protein
MRTSGVARPLVHCIRVEFGFCFWHLCGPQVLLDLLLEAKSKSSKDLQVFNFFLLMFLFFSPRASRSLVVYLFWCFVFFPSKDLYLFCFFSSKDLQVHVLDSRKQTAFVFFLKKRPGRLAAQIAFVFIFFYSFLFCLFVHFFFTFWIRRCEGSCGRR